MNTLFQRTNASWVRFSEYEYKQGEDARFILHLRLIHSPKSMIQLT